MHDVGLVVIATGKYQQFLPRLLNSATRHLEGFRTAFVLSDRRPTEGDLPVQWLPWGHLPWPYPTLLRYRAITAYADELAKVGTLMYVDVDMEFVNSVCLPTPGLIAVRHPGFVSASAESLPFERRQESTAYMPHGATGPYVAGGFQGGATARYLEAARELAAWAQADLNRGLIPVWHDESLWNRYVSTSDDVTLLDANYCWPEEKDNPHARLLALQKNHDDLRDVPIRDRLGRRISAAQRRLRARAGRTLAPIRSGCRR